MNSRLTDNLIKYGVSTDLANRAASSGLTVTKIRALNLKDIISDYGMTKEEARYLQKAIKRAPIDANTIQSLLENSNFLCCICKGEKGTSYIIHHIEEYEKTQNNDYSNLVVLCPNDHDLAHQGGLTLRITPDNLRKTKNNWEKQVEKANAQRAAQTIDIRDDAIDYVNVKRIEELCITLFNTIPKTGLSTNLKRAKILNSSGSFDQAYVKNHLSNGRYLFDYISHQETEHYKQLLQKISNKIEFIDLDTLLSKRKLLMRSEGKYAYFIGGVSAKKPKLPITDQTPLIKLNYSRKPFKLEWLLDPQFMMSMSSIGRIGGVNRYIIYCLIRSVLVESKNKILIKSSPLLIAQPKQHVDKTPNIAYLRRKSSSWILLDEDE